MRAYLVVSAAAALILTSACTADSPVAPTPVGTTSPAAPGGPLPTAIAIISGNEQHGKAGEQLAEPFVVRVTDAKGNGVSHAPVSFQVASGAGALDGGCDGHGGAMTRSSRTNSDGIATMTFRPTVLGPTTVTARIDELEDAAVTFRTEATVLVIEFWFGYWNVGFTGPCTLSSDVTAPIGTPVEWKVPVEDERYPITYTVTSTSTPPGGKRFDSGALTSRDRFRFVPTVIGTWEYRDQVTGLTGTLTVR